MRRENAFERVELLVVLGAIVALGCVLLTTLTRSKTGSDRHQCISNLKRIVLAELTWMYDNDKTDPHWQAPLADAGTMGHSQAHHAWFQWSWISNNLGSPKVLVCPADIASTAASDWTGTATGGFLNAKFQDAALSYFVNMSAGTFRRRERHDLFIIIDPAPPCDALTGDHAILVEAPTQACYRHTSLSYVCIDPSRPARWKTPPHGRNGNIAHLDGSVPSPESVALTSVLTNTRGFYQRDAPPHLLLPNRP
jgi:prepilin-type processing-associated H-X9-DG protein